MVNHIESLQLAAIKHSFISFISPKKNPLQNIQYHPRSFAKVIVATAYHLPSSCFIDWQHLAILIEEEDANRTGEIVKKYLEDPAKLEKMRKNLFRVRLLGPNDDDDDD